MYTKEDFLQVIRQSSMKYEQTAQLYQAGDPRVYQIQESMAQMLAMISQQIEVAMQEPFVKSRDATVLADAALKGLIFTSQPAVVQLTVNNQGKNAVTLNAGRSLLDSIGRHYRILEPVTINAGQNKVLKAQQVQVEIQTHIVEQSEPFYAVEVELPDDGSSVSFLEVKVNNTLFTPSYKFNGIGKDENVFHIDSDEFKRILVRFGENDVIGYQPVEGDVITIEKSLSFGNIQPELNSPFTLEYIQQAGENDLKFEMESLHKAGRDPVNIATLREMVRYPSIYDKNAVFLGEFEMLLRQKFHYCNFISIWNEREEEAVRGANVDNINTLFVAFELYANSPLNRADVQQQMIEAIQAADDSYKVKFVAPVVAKVQCQIQGTISRIYDLEQTKSQIIALLLSHYGKENIHVSLGRHTVKHKNIADLLSKNIQAISDQRGDFKVSVTVGGDNRPELFRFMDESSIQVDLTYDGYENHRWEGR